MPGRCSCSGSSCSCKVMPGPGIQVSGTGSEANPFVVSLASTPAQVTQATAGPLDLSGNVSTVALLLTLNANVTSVAMPAAGTQIDLIIQQGVASRTIAWPAAVKFPGGVDPVLSTVAGRYDWVRLVFAGNIWVGHLVGSNLS